MSVETIEGFYRIKTKDHEYLIPVQLMKDQVLEDIVLKYLIYISKNYKEAVSWSLSVKEKFDELCYDVKNDENIDFIKIVKFLYVYVLVKLAHRKNKSDVNVDDLSQKLDFLYLIKNLENKHCRNILYRYYSYYYNILNKVYDILENIMRKLIYLYDIYEEKSKEKEILSEKEKTFLIKIETNILLSKINLSNIFNLELIDLADVLEKIKTNNILSMLNKIKTELKNNDVNKEELEKLLNNLLSIEMDPKFKKFKTKVFFYENIIKELKHILEKLNNIIKSQNL